MSRYYSMSWLSVPKAVYEMASLQEKNSPSWWYENGAIGGFLSEHQAASEYYSSWDRERYYFILGAAICSDGTGAQASMNGGELLIWDAEAIGPSVTFPGDNGTHGEFIMCADTMDHLLNTDRTKDPLKLNFGGVKGTIVCRGRIGFTFRVNTEDQQV